MRAIPTLPSVVALGISFMGFGAVDCNEAAYSMCGSKTTGSTKCPANMFCQPYDNSPYLCLPVPLQCRNQLTDKLFVAINIATFANVTSSVDCCDKCDRYPGCKVYTFIYKSERPSKSACYLKANITAVVTINGTVSAKLD